jgi:hypothetical protein
VGAEGHVMWILILTLYWHSGTAVSSVPGFQTQQACMVAARFWQQRQQSLRDGPTADALCVKDQ